MPRTKRCEQKSLDDRRTWRLRNRQVIKTSWFSTRIFECNFYHISFIWGEHVCLIKLAVRTLYSWELLVYKQITHTHKHCQAAEGLLTKREATLVTVNLHLSIHPSLRPWHRCNKFTSDADAPIHWCLRKTISWRRLMSRWSKVPKTSQTSFWFPCL